MSKVPVLQSYIRMSKVPLFVALRRQQRRQSWSLRARVPVRRRVRSRLSWSWPCDIVYCIRYCIVVSDGSIRILRISFKKSQKRYQVRSITELYKTQSIDTENTGTLEQMCFDTLLIPYSRGFRTFLSYSILFYPVLICSLQYFFTFLYFLQNKQTTN